LPKQVELDLVGGEGNAVSGEQVRELDELLFGEIGDADCLFKA
jgi:hypothetical protein